MVKRKIIETVKEYDEKGSLVRETITETTEDDNTQYAPYYPYSTPIPTHHWDTGTITCKVSGDIAINNSPSSIDI